MNLVGKCVMQQCLSAKLTVKPAEESELAENVTVCGMDISSIKLSEYQNL